MIKNSPFQMPVFGAGLMKTNGIELKQQGVRGVEAGSTFKDILSSKLPVQRESSVDRQAANAVDAQRPRTYREIENERITLERKQVDKPESDPAGKKVNDDTKPEETQEGKKTEEAVMEGFAAVLGINPQDLMKLLKALDIKPEELVQQQAPALEKLASVLGLDEAQKSVLESLLKELTAQLMVAQEEGDTSSTSTTEKLDVKPEQTEKIQVVVLGQAQQTKKAELPEEWKALVNQVKQQLEQISAMVKQQPDTLKSLVAAQLEQMKLQPQPQVQTQNQESVEQPQTENAVETQTVQATSTDSIEGNGIQQKSEAQTQQQPGQDADKKDEKQQDSATVEQKPVATAEKAVSFDKTSTSAQVQAAAVNVEQPAAPDQVKETTKLNTPVPVRKEEVINQVVEKAKVILQGDKSEMLMELKPDNLGKLALKVVTERGMVVAQFVAESQQVKEIIETNMQLLKDSLEKQGMMVQGFSVTVQQDPGRQADAWQQGKQKGTTANDRTERAGLAQGIRTAGAAETVRTNNPYAWQGSSINLTA